MLTNTYLYQEIHEQPAVLRRFLTEERENVAALAAVIRKRQISHVVIAARGTSDNAGRYAQYVLGAFNGLPVALATPSLFSIYKRPPQFGNALVLGISQSGKSPDIVAVLAEAKRQGALTAVFTNSPASPLAAQGDFAIHLHAGAENAVAATKTYTSSLTAVALLSALLAADAGADAGAFAGMEAALQQLPDAVAATLAMSAPIATIAPRYRYMQRSVVIGRGYNYATAFEMALKMKELTYTIVEPYSSADFLHGPLALIESGFPVIVIAPTGVMLPEMQGFMRALREREAEIVGISDDMATLELARIPLALPQALPEWLSPITAIVPGQLFAMHLAYARDFDVDAPRAIHKVTETR